MARYTGPVCKLCRREGVKLFLKGERCYTKCVIDRKSTSTPPGQRAKRRSKISEYGKRLREKRKIRRMSAVLERQFRIYFSRAERMPGQTGENLLRLLETRLDNVVRRLGFTVSLAAARQLVLHGHIHVNGHLVDIPSYQLKPGDRIVLSGRMSSNLFIQRAMENITQRGLPSWLELEGKTGADQIPVAGKMKVWPSREEMSFPVNEQLVVEFYSK